MTGSTIPMATVSTASKNVALPTITRAFTCHADSGSASIRPRIFADMRPFPWPGHEWSVESNLVRQCCSRASLLLSPFCGRLIRNSWCSIVPPANYDSANATAIIALFGSNLPTMRWLE